MELEIGGQDAAAQEQGHQVKRVGAPGMDPALHTLPVHIVDSSGAIRVHQAPYDGSTARTKTLGTNATLLLSADHHRARVVLLGQSPFLVTFTGEVDTTQDSTINMAWWPANTALELRATTPIWAAAASGTCVLTIITERTTEAKPVGVN
jgi:hypothetical protein